MFEGLLIPSCGREHSGTQIAVWSNRSNSCGLGKEEGVHSASLRMRVDLLLAEGSWWKFWIAR